VSRKLSCATDADSALLFHAEGIFSSPAHALHHLDRLLTPHHHHEHEVASREAIFEYKPAFSHCPVS
jgi:hypothetical protein